MTTNLNILGHSYHAQVSIGPQFQQVQCVPDQVFVDKRGPRPKHGPSGPFRGGRFRQNSRLGRVWLHTWHGGSTVCTTNCRRPG